MSNHSWKQSTLEAYFWHFSSIYPKMLDRIAFFDLFMMCFNTNIRNPKKSANRTFQRSWGYAVPVYDGRQQAASWWVKSFTTLLQYQWWCQFDILPSQGIAGGCRASSNYASSVSSILAMCCIARNRRSSPIKVAGVTRRWVGYASDFQTGIVIVNQTLIRLGLSSSD